MYTNESFADIYRKRRRRRRKKRERNEPLFCKHIHVKIRIDNTRVVVGEDGEEQEQRAYREDERDKDWHIYR